MIKYIQKLMDKLKKSEKGQGMVEYALIIAFVAAIAIYVLNNGLKDAVKGSFDNASAMISSANAETNKINTVSGT
ncbi:MAG: Flp family type IVb pilin [Selenomonadaceae bacterium]|nr:Flp family type IVb pilin [Selenomonadaceae bacterium]